jgi:hypothetical protein
MSNNKNKLRSELTNLYGGTNKFLTNVEITNLVTKYNGSNAMNVKKQAYKQAYSKYYNHVFGNVFNKMMKIVKSEMKSSPQCPTGVNSGSVLKAVERSVQKRYGTGTTRGVKIGGVVGAAAGGVVGAGASLAARGGIATARGLGTAAGALVQFCKGNPSHASCGENSSSNERQNGRPSRSTAGQPPARITNSNRRGAPPARSRRGPNQN